MSLYHDWTKVVELEPKGYLELNDGNKVLHGPIESIHIDELDMIQIKLKWAAQCTLNATGLPSSAWKVAPSDKTFGFPNFIVPYTIEATPRKGRRVRFGFNLLYIDKVDGLDPTMIKGLKL